MKITFKSELNLLCHGRKAMETAMISWTKEVYRFYGFTYGHHRFNNHKEQPALVALADKIDHMVFSIGCPSSVAPMLERIVADKVKRCKYPNYNKCNGTGHFRWNYKVYTLDDKELEYLKQLMEIK